MTQHGFTRDMDFEVLKQGNDQVVFELHSSDETKNVYPFDFVLRLSFKVTENGIQAGYEVENPADEDMWFGIGGHPAFKVPMDQNHYYDDYVVKLDPQTTRNLIPLKGPYADIDHLKEERTSEISVSHDAFKNDAIILDLGEEPTTITLTDNEQTTTNTTYISLGSWVDSVSELGEYTYNIETRTLYKYKTRSTTSSSEYTWATENPGNGFEPTGRSRKVFVSDRPTNVQK